MKSYLWIGLLAAATLAGCGQKTEPEPPAAPKAAAPGTALPPAGAAYRFVGQWATNPAACNSNPWTITATHLDGDADQSCDLKSIATVAGGYTVEAICGSDNTPLSPSQINIAFAEQAKTMTLSGGPFDAASLIWCGS